jgi:hypothetical protein
MSNRVNPAAPKSARPRLSGGCSFVYSQSDARHGAARVSPRRSALTSRRGGGRIMPLVVALRLVCARSLRAGESGSARGRGWHQPPLDRRPLAASLTAVRCLSGWRASGVLPSMTAQGDAPVSIRAWTTRRAESRSPLAFARGAVLTFGLSGASTGRRDSRGAVCVSPPRPVSAAAAPCRPPHARSPWGWARRWPRAWRASGRPRPPPSPGWPWRAPSWSGGRVRGQALPSRAPWEARRPASDACSARVSIESA